MNNAALARKYAGALMEVGRERGEAARYAEDLGNLAEVFRSNSALAPALLNPMNDLEKRLTLMNDVCRAINGSEAVEKFMDILVESRHVKLVPQISNAYSRLHDEISGRIRATVEAPAELPAEMLAEIRERLQEITGKDVTIEFKERPGLIGGLVVRLDNTVIDGSLRTQLDLLRSRLVAEG